MIFHGANPPGYRNWRGLAIPMLNNTIAAARQSGARIIFPGNVYNFGPDAGSVVREDSPQHPLTRKGKVRVEMEQLLAAAGKQGIRSLVIRAGDFFGPHQPASWLKDAMIKPGKPLQSIVYPGDFRAGHAWAYLPDLAETVARLANIEKSLPAFDRFHFGGHWLEHGVQFAEAIRHVSGNPQLPIRKLPWIVFYLGAPFVTFLREALEMRYLWRTPLRLDNTKLVAAIGAEPHTFARDSPEPNSGQPCNACLALQRMRLLRPRKLEGEQRADCIGPDKGHACPCRACHRTCAATRLSCRTQAVNCPSRKSRGEAAFREKTACVRSNSAGTCPRMATPRPMA